MKLAADGVIVAPAARREASTLRDKQIHMNRDMKDRKLNWTREKKVTFRPVDPSRAQPY